MPNKSNLFSSLPENLPQDKKEDEGQKLPEELQGKSPEEMYEMLTAENERLLEEQKKKLAESQQQSGQPQQQQQSQQGQQGQQVPYTPPAQNWNYGGQGQSQEEIDYWSDPEKFMNQQLDRRLQPLVQTTVQSLRGTNRSNFIRDVGQEQWQKYGPEVEQLMDSFNPQLQMNPEAYKQAYNIVLAGHIDEVSESKAEQLAAQKLQTTLEKLGIGPEQLEGLANESQGQQQQQQRQSLFQRNIGVPVVETGSQSGSSNPRGSKPKGKRLSAEEREMAEAFGLTDDEYRDWQKLNTDIVSQLGGE